jgi:hypothetical protein
VETIILGEDREGKMIFGLMYRLGGFFKVQAFMSF